MLLKNQKPNYKYRDEIKEWQRDLVTVGYSLKIDGYFGDETEKTTRQFQKDMKILVDGIVGPQSLAAMEIKKGTINSNYQIGSIGIVVRWIQKQYKDRGYKLLVDGKFGPETERITILFQRDMNIQIDGIVGPETFGKLAEGTKSSDKNKFKIYIDNGHSPGNVNSGSQGYKEWEGNLKSAKYLAQLLLNDEFDVLMTYDWNPNAGLTARGDMAADWGADVFFSIHSNAGGGAGSECYYSIDIPTDKIYAQEIANKISREFNIPNRGAKIKSSSTDAGEDWMTVVDTAQDRGIKHVFLVESMFHDNIEEEKLLLNEDTHKKLAGIYKDVIVSLFENK